MLEDLEVVAGRLRTEVLSESVDQTQVREHLSSQSDNGSWPDIDYDDTSRTHWIPREHLRRILNLARSYRTEGGDLAGDADVPKAFLNGLRYWTERDPQSDNWFRQSIGSPATLGDAAILMVDEIPADLLEATGEQVRRSGFTRTGANLVWEASNLLTWACVTKDPDLLYEVVERIGSEIVVTTDEGIQPDNSFHQHGPQLYSLGYGRSYAANVTRIAVLLSETAFAFPKEKIDILSRLILDGQQWFVRGRQIDYHTMGREAFRGRPGRHNWNARGLVGTAENMRVADPSRAAEYEAMLARFKGKTQAGESGPLGNKHFWRSDTMVHRAKDWYASVRFHSTRTYACEVRVNRENLLGYHLSDGVMFLMQRGDEYHDLQPLWDYRKLPGLTFTDTDEPIPYGRDVPRGGNTEFVGGVSDGESGVAVMYFFKDGVRARKAYFFADSGIVCLGAGIASERSEPVITTLNQCRLKSEVVVLKQGDEQTLEEGEVKGADVQAVWHDGVGYIILEPAEIGVTARSQSGSWARVEAKASADPLTEKVFTSAINHGRGAASDSYAYRVLPGIASNEIRDAAIRNDDRVLINDASVQAIHHAAGLYQIVFHEPGSLTREGHPQISTDTPCVMQVSATGEALSLSVADPTQTASNVTLTVSGRYAGDGATYLTDSNITRIDMTLPTGGEAGSSAQVALRAVSDSR